MAISFFSLLEYHSSCNLNYHENGVNIVKRTVEIVLTSVGTALNVLGTVIMAILLFFSSTSAFKEGFQEGMLETTSEDGVMITTAEANTVLELLSGAGWVVLAFFLVGAILGGVAIYFFVGNKKPKAASLITLITGIVMTVGTFFIGLIPGILYAIAGSVGLLRKPPIEEPIDYVIVDEESEEPNPFS